MILNRTNAYLKRILSLESKTFVSLLIKMESETVGFFADDFLFRKVTKNKEEYLFMKVKFSKVGEFPLFMKHIRKCSPYYTDYVSSIYDTHVIVFKVKPEFQLSFKMFKKGLYSQMYTLDQFKKLNFPKSIKNNPSNVYRVLTKDPEAYPYLCDMIRTRFSVKEFPKKEECVEYDLPPNKEDYLNYSLKEFSN